jgi:hypothetical protein
MKRQRAEVNEIVGVVAFGMPLASIVVMIVFPMLGMSVPAGVLFPLVVTGLLALSIPYLRRRTE